MNNKQLAKLATLITFLAALCALFYFRTTLFPSIFKPANSSTEAKQEGSVQTTVIVSDKTKETKSENKTDEAKPTTEVKSEKPADDSKPANPNQA